MKKRTMLCIIIFSVLCVSVYTQTGPEFETVRYYSWFEDKYFTVRAAHFGWIHTYQTISSPGTRGARELQYISWKVRDEVEPNAQWSDWELSEDSVSPYVDFSILRGAYSLLVENWRTHPISGEIKMIKGGFKAVMISAVPNGRTTPFWIDDDGNLHHFWKLYAVEPQFN